MRLVEHFGTMSINFTTKESEQTSRVSRWKCISKYRILLGTAVLFFWFHNYSMKMTITHAVTTIVETHSSKWEDILQNKRLPVLITSKKQNGKHNIPTLPRIQSHGFIVFLPARSATAMTKKGRKKNMQQFAGRMFRRVVWPFKKHGYSTVSFKTRRITRTSGKFSRNTLHV